MTDDAYPAVDPAHAITKPLDSEGNVLTADSNAGELLMAILRQLTLLNVRFQEAFETHISEADVDEN
mgnify:CR=1 FL=1|tara:strand:- start:15410 stop:15610 length:201 start_codon:yes stop_codon:yes gene_type:complete